MIVTCFICGEDFEIDIDEAIRCNEEIINNEMCCDDCAKAAIEATISRN